ncbi:MAG: hypothetical protein M1835_000709 [Candelina submexicana]|nr:MAG: hypothetical protein M1835_000709 [Candelina submexicana]
MAPTTPPPPPSTSSDEHQHLLDTLDIARLPRPFRSRTWKPSQRRNKTIKQITSETARKAEASSLNPTPGTNNNNSGTSTPLPPATSNTTNGALNGSSQPNIVQAARNLSSLALANSNGTPNGPPAIMSTYPTATYTNIESAPSLHPGHQRHYCDITGLPAPYTDPKTRLRYHNKEVFGVVRGLGQGVAEQYLEARGAHTVLK